MKSSLCNEIILNLSIEANPITDEHVEQTEEVVGHGVRSLLRLPVRMQEVADVFRRKVPHGKRVRKIPWIVALLVGVCCSVHFNQATGKQQLSVTQDIQ